MVVEDQAHIEEACQYQPSAVLFSDNEAHNAAPYLLYARKNPCENRPMVSEKPMWAHLDMLPIVSNGPTESCSQSP
jgi:hypothetical protein